MTHSRAAKHDGDRVRTPTEMAALQELEFAIHASPTPLLLVDSHGQIVRANRRVEQLFGYERGELLGLDVEVLVPESVHAHHAELRDAFIELPTSRAMGRGRDLHGQTKSGALIPIEIGLDPIERAGENWVIVSILDITERVSAERRIRMALDAVSNAVVMIDARGTIVLANAQTSAMFGRPRGQLIGKPIETLVPERYHRRHQVFRTSYLNVKQARRMGMGRELFGLHADGHEFPVEIALTPIESPDGVLIMSTIMDLTERRRHELETQARNRQLSALNADLTQFAYSASHDLKAPLISISGLLKFAGDDLDAGDLDEVRANLGKAERLAARLARRIEEMLAIAKAEDETKRMTSVDLDQLVRETWEAMPKGAGPEAPDLTLDLQAHGALVTSRPMLAGILENLFSNSLKFADPAKGQARIVLASRTIDEGTEIAVSDNGIGIPVERHSEVFKMFRRFSGTTAEGAGLGLALVRKYVEVLGGQIRFESSPAGTTFVFVIPNQMEST